MFDAAHRAALETHRPLVFVCPPAGWPVRELFAALPAAPGGAGVDTLVLVPETGDALDVAAALTGQSPTDRTVHPVTGLSRAERLARGCGVSTLIARPQDAHYLLRRSALKAATLRRTAVLWPENLLDSDDLDAVLAGAPDAQRLVVTQDQSRAQPHIERYAHRAPVVVAGGIPQQPVGRARYAVVAPSYRVEAARRALDVLSPDRALIWDPLGPDRWRALTTLPDVASAPEATAEVDLAIAADLPTTGAWERLRHAAAEVVVLLRAGQVPYLESLVREVEVLRLDSDVDRLRQEAASLRADLRAQLGGLDLTTGLLAIEPLLDDYDPVVLAAAALTLRPAAVDQDVPGAWQRVYVSVGRRDQIRAADLLGALRRVGGLAPTDVGRIDVRENFALVDVRPDRVEHAIRTVNGAKVRGRRVTVRRFRTDRARDDRSD